MYYCPYMFCLSSYQIPFLTLISSAMLSLRPKAQKEAIPLKMSFDFISQSSRALGLCLMYNGNSSKYAQDDRCMN